MSFDYINESELLALPGAVQLLTTFFFGFLTSLTPCVYPLIPVTLAIFGAHGDISRVRAFLLSATYVGGISLTYTVLGICSAQTGVVFGSVLGNPVVIGVISTLLVLLSLFTLEVVPMIHLGHSLRTKATHIGQKGFLGAFLMGSLSGVVAAPCVGPVLAIILVVAAASKSTVWGALLLFAYSIGLGMLFLLLGTFSGLLHKLPRSGDWLYYVKFLMAAALLTVTLFIIQPFVPDWSSMLNIKERPWVLSGIAVLACIGGRIGYKHNLKTIKVSAALLLSLTIYQLVIPSSAPHLTAQDHGAPSTWINNSKDALEQGRVKNKIVMLDFYADWCVACKELDALTFSNPSVVSQLKNLVTARIDYAAEEELAATYNVVGLPCVLFIAPDGKEIPDSRIVGFIEADRFLEHLRYI